MTMQEKRKCSRIDSINLLNYLYFEESEADANQGMGRTLNVSESGILLETHTPIEVPYKVSLTIGLQEDVVDIKGRVIYMKENSKGLYESGIEFFDVGNQALKVLRRYITAFHSGAID
ncbi:MAG: PilZ domain-containing protein [Desulfatitalea sp.]|nr:PilZ domain-containing protein [Desulfatitalea sp.]